MEQREYIESAVASFRALLEEQLSRVAAMEEAQGLSDKQKECIRIGIVEGDGIGPIITAVAKEALEALLKEEIQSGRIILKDIPGLTIENRLKQSRPIPEESLEAIRACDVLLKGPTTTPSGGTMESANVALRREMDLYANVRPVCVPQEGIDWTFFRENTEGEYTLGSKGIALDGLMAMDFKVTTAAGTRRIARAAFEFAKNNGKTHVAIVTKSNIMKKTDGLFSQICHEIAAEYPGIQADEYYIDIMSANLINPQVNKNYQVFVLPNLYGDIITDEAAQIQGGVGTAGSANIGDEYAMFEAIHGSAPRMIAEGLGEYANPESILRAAVMMLRHIGLVEKAEKLNAAIDAAARACPVNGTREGATCKAFGEKVKKEIAWD